MMIIARNLPISPNKRLRASESRQMGEEEDAILRVKTTPPPGKFTDFAETNTFGCREAYARSHDLFKADKQNSSSLLPRSNSREFSEKTLSLQEKNVEKVNSI